MFKFLKRLIMSYGLYYLFANFGPVKENRQAFKAGWNAEYERIKLVEPNNYVIKYFRKFKNV